MKTSIGIFHWLPRILCIIAILFISMFAADAISSEATLLQNILALFIHLIPSFVLLALLIFAWNWENWGGIIFIILGTALSPYIFLLNYSRNGSVSLSLSIILMVTFPFIITGALFILSHAMKKKNIHPKERLLQKSL